jgi:hypothetical protein
MQFFAQTTYEGFHMANGDGSPNYFHAAPHICIGGTFPDGSTKGDMANAYISPSDPYFFCKF